MESISSRNQFIFAYIEIACKQKATVCLWVKKNIALQEFSGTLSYFVKVNFCFDFYKKLFSLSSNAYSIGKRFIFLCHGCIENFLMVFLNKLFLRVRVATLATISRSADCTDSLMDCCSTSEDFIKLDIWAIFFLNTHCLYILVNISTVGYVYHAYICVPTANIIINTIYYLTYFFIIGRRALLSLKK